MNKISTSFKQALPTIFLNFLLFFGGNTFSFAEEIAKTSNSIDINSKTKTSLTVYSSAAPGSISPDLYRTNPVNPNASMNSSVPGYAMVRTSFETDLKEGANRLLFSNVAPYLDPTTVMIRSLTDPEGINLNEQNYYFDLSSKQALLEKSIGQEITVEQAKGNQTVKFTGKLLSSNGEIMLQTSDGKVISINDYSDIQFSNSKNDLIVQPTLNWEIYSKKSGKQTLETSYQTNGITWWADYNAIFEEGKENNSDSLKLNAWVSIVNRSGLGYENVALKLISGTINRIESMRRLPRLGGVMALQAGTTNGTQGFSEKDFFEYHAYDLGRTINLPNHSTKQLELFPSTQKTLVMKQYFYKGAKDSFFSGGINTNKEFGVDSNTEVNVTLKFTNDKKSGLGIPLPGGRIRVNKLDKMGALEFMGEDIIPPTSKDEEVTITVGKAYDLVGERKQINFTADNNRHTMSETYEITLKNHKDQDVEVIVVEPMNRGDSWKIVDNTLAFKKIDATLVQFNVPVKKDGENKLRYTVQYSW